MEWIGTFTFGQRGLESNGNEGVYHITQISKSETSLSNVVKCHNKDISQNIMSVK